MNKGIFSRFVNRGTSCLIFSKRTIFSIHVRMVVYCKRFVFRKGSNYLNNVFSIGRKRVMKGISQLSENGRLDVIVVRRIMRVQILIYIWNFCLWLVIFKQTSIAEQSKQCHIVMLWLRQRCFLLRISSTFLS